MLWLLQHRNKNHCPTLLIHNGSHCFNFQLGKGYLFRIFSDGMKEFDILKCKNTHKPKYYTLYSTGDSKRPIQAYFVCEDCSNNPIYNDANSIIHMEELREGTRITVPNFKELKFPDDFPADFLKDKKGIYL